MHAHTNSTSQKIVLYRHRSGNSCIINELLMHSLKIFFGIRKHVLCMGVFGVHNSHLWSQANPHVTRIRGYQDLFSTDVWASIIGDILV
jgi:hypothetical protein